jgi:hypothetical protein
MSEEKKMSDSTSLSPTDKYAAVFFILGVGGLTLVAFFVLMCWKSFGFVGAVLSCAILAWIVYLVSSHRDPYGFLGHVAKVEAGGLVPAGLAYLLTRWFTANYECACCAALLSGMLGFSVVLTILEIRYFKHKRSQDQAE